MKKTLILIGLFIIYSCGGSDKKSQKGEIENKLTKWEQLMQEANDTSVQNSNIFDIDPTHFDTVNIESSPLQIINKVTGKEKGYLGLEDEVVIITYRNVSGKDIAAVKMRWYCEDAFGEPVLLMSKHIIRMFIGDDRNNTKLKAGEEDSIKWIGSASDLHRVVSAWAYEVAFVDGLIWKVSGK